MFTLPGSAIAPFILSMGFVYLAREILIPVALAVLITFLLSPLVMALQRRGLPRGLAVLVMVLCTTLSLAVIGLVIASQIADLVDQVPSYKANIMQKVQVMRQATSGPIERASTALALFRRELAGAAAPAPAPARRSVPGAHTSATTSRIEAPGTGTADAPMFVEMVQSSNIFQMMASLVGPVLSPLATTTMILVLVVFMLIERETLRDRFFALIGADQLSISTQALDDAAKGVSRYLLMQSLINVGFGITIALGLFCIGIPCALLWGFLAAVLRYVPYVGAALAALMPVSLALVASTSWLDPVLAIVLFAVVELVTGQVLEPWLYGSGTGLSPIAILLTAVFWTWMWGGIGLILATPLTVCLLVMSRHVHQMQFLTILLGAENALPPDARLYQRLLAKDTLEAGEIVAEACQKTSLIEVLDTMILPVLRLAEADRQRDRLEPARQKTLYENLQVILEDVDERVARASEIVPAATIVCLPARDEADELAGQFLGQILRPRPVRFEMLSPQLTAGEMIEKIQLLEANVVCISAIPPFASQHARYVFKRIRRAFPELKILVALWGVKPESKSYRGMQSGGADRIASSMTEALELLDGWLPIQAA